MGKVSHCDPQNVAKLVIWGPQTVKISLSAREEQEKEITSNFLCNHLNGGTA